MQFLAPLFFVALAGLAIPVLLHLTQREKKQIVHFPSLMFVRRIPYESVRRRKIHNWLLLMVRLAALALIIFAFARPLISRADQAPPPGAGAREVVILVDGSYSMGYGDHWQRAVGAARDQINRLNASDRGSVVVFGSSADILLRTTSERDRLTAALTASQPRPSATRFAPALKVAGSILAESSLPRREVVLISDFQRGGWRGDEGAHLPMGVTMTPVAIQNPADRPNVTVTGVSIARSTFSNQERAVVTAGVVNRTERPVSGATMTLEVGGLPIATKPLAVEPGSAATIAFDPFTISAKNLRGTVRLSDDALAADNSFNFVISPSEPLHLTVVDRGGASTLYLSRALSIGDAPRFDVVTREPDAVSDEDLRKSAVVLLNDVEVGVGFARRLNRYVEQGGGLFVATGSHATWPQEVDLLPATIGPPVDRSRGDFGRIGALEYGHPIFEVFRAPRSGDFSAVPVYGYRNLTTAKDAQVLARFDAGTPAVVERKVGGGRVVMWGSTMDVTWSEFPQRPVFLPFVHRAVRHLANYKEPQPWVTVGQVLDPAATSVLRGQRVVLTPGGKRLPIDDEGSDVVELSDQGFYELRGDKNQNVTVVAVNVDPAEADLTPMDPKEIVAAATGSSGEDEGATVSGVPLTPEAKEKNQRLWWYLLCGGIVLLAADTLLSNRLGKT
ncbi:MAG TPA: BatA domain-containing protein [Vicinamibacterales bacterium]|jgi:aerotolerance regulator-like protein/VWA domain-containing protein|nr:BatA domain-containing protein [Vicinamibacterales bacterium]